MKYITIAFLVLFACSKNEKKVLSPQEFVATAKLDSTNLYGAKPSLLNEQPSALADAIKAESFGKAIRLVSRVTNSCSSKGCWMIINDKDQTVRVTFKDYGFFVPLGFKDRDVVIEGILSEEEVPEDVLKHFAEDEGKSAEEIAKIKGSMKEYTFIATSVVALPK